MRVIWVPTEKPPYRSVFNALPLLLIIGPAFNPFCTVTYTEGYVPSVKNSGPLI